MQCIYFVNMYNAFASTPKHLIVNTILAQECAVFVFQLATHIWCCFSEFFLWLKSGNEIVCLVYIP